MFDGTTTTILRKGLDYLKTMHLKGCVQSFNYRSSQLHEAHATSTSVYKHDSI
jgi:hypothetical protein